MKPAAYLEIAVNRLSYTAEAYHQGLAVKLFTPACTIHPRGFGDGAAFLLVQASHRTPAEIPAKWQAKDLQLPWILWFPPFHAKGLIPKKAESPPGSATKSAIITTHFWF